MTTLVFHHNYTQLPPATDGVLRVQLYGLEGQSRGEAAIIGHPIIDKIKRLGINIPSHVMDFVTIALAVTAADTFVQRSEAADGWARQMSLQLPLHNPDHWKPLKANLEEALHFLSGDMWNFDFLDGGFPPPTAYRRRERRLLTKLRGRDCVCLFSGGLDSAIGAIDLLEEGHSPLFVSHAYKGDKTHQDEIADALPGHFSRFAVNASPFSSNGETDISMRTRSINFLAFGALCASAVQQVNGRDRVDLIVPENGLISLNAPLTSRRVGTYSTRTTHPHFIAAIQNIFDSADIPCTIKNPYQFQTKGEMVANCRNQGLLAQIVDDTVSCSHWKRSNQQCGVCVPCIIRRAALYAGGIDENISYKSENLVNVLDEETRRDDLVALLIAIEQKATRKPGPWILDSGPLPSDKFVSFKEVFLRGLNEVEAYLVSEGVE